MNTSGGRANATMTASPAVSRRMTRTDNVSRRRSSSALVSSNGDAVGLDRPRASSPKGGSRENLTSSTLVRSSSTVVNNPDNMVNFNAAIELQRMHDTPRAVRFTAFLLEKRSAEPYLCWKAIEELVRQVRYDTLEAEESRSEKVAYITREFVSEGGPNQLALQLALRERMEELCARLAANSEYWDVRPVLALQREVEVLLLGDLLDFAERFPWTDDDLNSGRMSAVLLVRRLALADVTPARREKLLRVSRRDTVGLAASFRTTTHRVGKSLLRAVSRMPAVELGANKDMAMLCELGADALTMVPDNDDERAQLELPLANCALVDHAESNKFELQHHRAADPCVYFFTSAESVAPWVEAIRATQAKLEKHARMIEEKRQRILAQPMQVPAKVRHFVESNRHLPIAVVSAGEQPDTPPAKSSARQRDMLPVDLRQGKSLERIAQAEQGVAQPAVADEGYTMAAHVDVAVAAVVPPPPPSAVRVPQPSLTGTSSPSQMGYTTPASTATHTRDDVAAAAAAALEAAASRSGYHADTSPAVTGYAMPGATTGYATVPAAMSGSPRLSYFSSSPDPVATDELGYRAMSSSALRDSPSAAAVTHTDSDDDSSSSSSSNDSARGGSGRTGAASEGGGRGDFNEIFQSCVSRLQRLQQSATPAAERLRMEAYVELIGVAEDFVASAVRYGQIIISEVYLHHHRKTIKPDASVGGVIGGEKYVVHNILFKFALDSHGVFGGNDEHAAKVAGLELKGLQAYVSTKTPDLCFPLMALIDYKGFRLVASSLLPLDRGSLRYGSQNAGQTVLKSHDELTRRIEEASAKLNLKKHEAGRARVVMASAVDIEGHVGRDGRMYMLDFSRVFPPVRPDRNVEGSHLIQMFRPEFVTAFAYFPLCSDAYSQFVMGLPDAREHMDEIDTATNELLNVTITNVMRELLARMDEEIQVSGSLASFTLTEFLHSHGINVRYLGEVTRKMGRHPYALFMLAEMVARVVKQGFRRTLRDTMKRLRVSIDEPYRIAVKDFLNLVFSSTPESEVYWANEVPKYLDERFKIRPGNWTMFPRELKKTLFELDRIGNAPFNAKYHIFRAVQNAIGFQVAPSLRDLLETQPRVYLQRAVFDDVDVEDVGLRVKFLDVISNAQGYVFTRRAEENHAQGFTQAAMSLYQRAYAGYQAALNSSPNDHWLLMNCALVLTQLYRMAVAQEAAALDSAVAKPNGDAAASPSAGRIAAGARPLSMRVERAPPANQPAAASLDTHSTSFMLRVHATRYYKRAIQADRRSAASYGAYAQFLSESGQDAEAEAHYIEALLREPNNARMLAGYAALLQRMGNAQQAEVFAQRSRSVDRLLNALLESSSASSQEFRRTLTSNSFQLASFRPALSAEQLLDL